MRFTLREFVRQLAKSRTFRQLYWENLYITKAIEYIHRRLLGRPTYGREELNRYYDLVSKNRVLWSGGCSDRQQRICRGVWG